MSEASVELVVCVCRLRLLKGSSSSTKLSAFPTDKFKNVNALIQASERMTHTQASGDFCLLKQAHTLTADFVCARRLTGNEQCARLLLLLLLIYRQANYDDQ